MVTVDLMTEIDRLADALRQGLLPGPDAYEERSAHVEATPDPQPQKGGEEDP